jgi:hypothetical protein
MPKAFTKNYDGRLIAGRYKVSDMAIGDQVFLNVEILIGMSWLLCQSAVRPDMPTPAYTEEWWEWCDGLLFSDLDPCDLRLHNYKFPIRAAGQKLIKLIPKSDKEGRKDAREALSFASTSDATWAIWSIINKSQQISTEK